MPLNNFCDSKNSLAQSAEQFFVELKTSKIIIE
jgi:hypothetical protein